MLTPNKVYLFEMFVKSEAECANFEGNKGQYFFKDKNEFKVGYK